MWCARDLEQEWFELASTKNFADGAPSDRAARVGEIRASSLYLREYRPERDSTQPPAQHAHRLNEQLDAEPATPPEAPAAVREVLLVGHAARVGVALRQRPEEPRL